MAPRAHGARHGRDAWLTIIALPFGKLKARKVSCYVLAVRVMAYASNATAYSYTTNVTTYILIFVRPSSSTHGHG